MQEPEARLNFASPFRVGEFVVDPGANRVGGPQSDRKIEPKAMQVLCILASRQGQTVRREELLETVWAGRVVVDETLTRAISLLRQALADGSSGPGYIQTVPKQGYRLVALVSAAETRVPPAQPAVTMPTESEEPTVESEQKFNKASAKVNQGSRRPLLFAVIALIVAASGLLVFSLFSPSSSISQGNQISSVAVLPFAKLDESKETAYLAAGVAEELINALARVPDLRVPSRHSSFAFEGRGAALADIATALDVRHVLEGSVQRSGDALRISARLVEVSTDTTVWSHQYNGELQRIFAMEEEIASGVIEALSGQKQVGVAAGSSFARTPNVDAYSVYLQGQYWWMNGTTGNWFYQARDAFEQAVSLDPEFAEAYASLAYIYARHDFHDQYMPGDIARARAADAIDRALALNSEAVDAHLAQAILATSNNDFASARAALDRALQIEPRNPVAHYLDAELQIARNNPELALQSAKRALALDPLSPWVNVSLGIVHYYRGEYAAAKSAIDEAVRIDPEYTWAYLWRAMVLHAEGQLAAAVLSMRRCLALDPSSETNAAYMGLLYLDLMDQAKARYWFEYAASLQGDNERSRLWGRLVSLAVDREDDELLLGLAEGSFDELHNSRFSLVPVIQSALLAQGRSEEVPTWLTRLLPSSVSGELSVQPQDGVIALELAAVDSSPALWDAIGEGIAAFPQYYRKRGLEAQWHLIQGREAEAMQSLNDAFADGGVLNFWMLPQLSGFSEISQTRAFQKLIETARARAHAQAELLAGSESAGSLKKR